MKRRTLTTAVTVATLMSLPAISLPAHAAPAPPEPLTALTLTVTSGHYEPVGPGQNLPAPSQRSATLSCDPVGGTHPEAIQACADLKKADGFSNLPSLATPRACYMIYAPVAVTATGHIGQTLVRFQATYSNDCVLATQTGSIFAF